MTLQEILLIYMQHLHTFIRMPSNTFSNNTSERTFLSLIIIYTEIIFFRLFASHADRCSQNKHLLKNRKSKGSDINMKTQGKFSHITGVYF
jgi:hypothetical protein